MATTVQDATLTSVITDSVTLNGTTYGGVTTSTLTNIDEVYQRIMTIPAYVDRTQDFVSLIAATNAPNSAGDIDVTKFSYARFTNLDDNYPVYLRVTNNDGVCDTNPASATYVVLLNPGASFLLQDHVFLAGAGTIEGRDAINTNNHNRFFTVYALAVPEAADGCDLEMFVATK